MFDQCTDISPDVRNEQTCERFAVVSFPEDEILYIVASSWLEKAESSDFHICSWPPYKGDTRIKVAVIENEIPSSTWSKCYARLIKKYSTYESAEEILKAIETIYVHRSETLFEKKHKQIQDECSQKQLKIEANSLSSRVDFNSSSASSNSSQSGPIICAITANADESSLHTNSSMESIEDIRRNSLSIQSESESFLGDSSRQSPLSNASNGNENNRNSCHNSELDCQTIEDENFLLHNSTPETSVKNRRNNSLSTQTHLSGSEMLWQPFSSNSKGLQMLNEDSNERTRSKSNFELHILKSLNEIKQQVAQTSYLLNENSKQLNENSKQLLLLSEGISDSKENSPLALNNAFKGIFPFSSAKDLLQFDLKLRDTNFKKDLIKYFSNAGGTTVAKCTAQVLSKIMKPSAAVDFCWFGNKQGKEAFCRLEIMDALQVAVRVHFKNATDLEIKKTAQHWFRHAKEKLMRSLKASTPKKLS